MKSTRGTIADYLTLCDAINYLKSVEAGYTSSVLEWSEAANMASEIQIVASDVFEALSGVDKMIAIKLLRSTKPRFQVDPE